MLIDTQRDGLIEIFGHQQYDRVRQDVAAGVDSYFEISEEMWEHFQAEADMENNRVKPVPRRSCKTT